MRKPLTAAFCGVISLRVREYPVGAAVVLSGIEGKHGRDPLDVNDLSGFSPCIVVMAKIRLTQYVPRSFENIVVHISSFDELHSDCDVHGG